MDDSTAAVRHCSPPVSDPPVQLIQWLDRTVKSACNGMIQTKQSRKRED